MNAIASQIHGNANWRQDTGKTAAQVAAEMNAVRVVLIPGSAYSLVGLQEKLGVDVVATIEYSIQKKIKEFAASGIEAYEIGAVKLQQMLDGLRSKSPPDFGLPATQTNLDGLTGILAPELINALKALGQQVQYDEVTEAQVTDAWAWLAAFDARQTVASDLKREVDRLDTMLHNPGEFDAQVALIKALAEEI